MDEQQKQTTPPPAAGAPDGKPAEPAAAPPPEVPAKEDELVQAKTKADEYLAGWQRANADYANLKRAMEQDREEFAKYAAANLVKQLLPALDSFRKAGPPPDPAQLDQWAQGVNLIRQQFETALKNAGVTVIDQAGTPFDPSLHEAMMMEKAGKDAPPGTVTKVLEPGYKLHDKVLRAAKVAVAE